MYYWATVLAAVSGGASIIFFFGGKNGGGHDIFQGGGQDPEKVIDFEPYVQDKAHIFILSEQVCPFFLDFTES